MQHEELILQENTTPSNAGGPDDPSSVQQAKREPLIQKQPYNDTGRVS